MSDSSDLESRLRAELEGDVLFGDFDRGRYSTDASIYPIRPRGVVVAGSDQDVVRAIQIASDACKRCLSRLAGLEAPTWEDDEATLDELRARIVKTIDYAQSVPAEKIDGSEEREILLPIPNGELKFPGEAFLKSFSLPNFFFHCTMTYALLRQGGVDLGKMDYLGAP